MTNSCSPEKHLNVMSGYVLVSRTEEDKNDSVELPTEDDGTLLLSVVQSQFEGASGIRYRNQSTGGWRAIKLSDGVLRPPGTSGWGDTNYIIVMGAGGAGVAKTESSEANTTFTGYSISNVPAVGYHSDGSKRIKLDEPQPTATDYSHYARPPSPPQSSEDLIILGLEWSVTTDELKQYFEKFGEIVSAEVKTDLSTGKSRGFGFVRFSDPQVREKVAYDLNHAIKGRKVDVKFPKAHSNHPTKLFVGCLPLKPEVEKDELEAHFSDFGKLTDVYIPKPYRGFGFITFGDPNVTQRVLNMQHTLRKSQLNLSFADPKGASAAKTAQLQYPPHYPQQDYSAYQQQYNYGQYAAHYGQTGYAAQPQVSSGYNYGAYATANNPQVAASYDRSYMDGRTHPQPQYVPSPQQQQPQRYPVQSSAQTNIAYAHPHYQSQTYSQTDPQHYQYPHQPRSSPPEPPKGHDGRQQPYPPRVPAASGVEQPRNDLPRGYDPKSIWQNY